MEKPESQDKNYQNEKGTIGELKDMPRNDGYGHVPTIGENEQWLGFVEDW